VQRLQRRKRRLPHRVGHADQTRHRAAIDHARHALAGDRLEVARLDHRHAALLGPAHDGFGQEMLGRAHVDREQALQRLAIAKQDAHLREAERAELPWGALSNRGMPSCKYLTESQIAQRLHSRSREARKRQLRAGLLTHPPKYCFGTCCTAAMESGVAQHPTLCAASRAGGSPSLRQPWPTVLARKWLINLLVVRRGS
jgi:hypothetical protein